MKNALRNMCVTICGNDFSDTLHTGNREYFVIVHTPLSREVFWHEDAKIPRHTSQNSIAVGNLEFWLVCAHNLLSDLLDDKIKI